jgi:ABC-2 type transport system permease protein
VTVTSSFQSLTRAMFLGFRRDRRALFFTILLPLVFLVIFGGVFGHASAPKVTIAEAGQVPILDAAMGHDTSHHLSKIIKLTRADTLKDAQNKVKKGDADLGVQATGPGGGDLTLFYSGSNQVTSGTAQSIMQDLVQTANVEASNTPPKFRISAVEQVEDKSLKPIQFFTPGLLGWALASAGIFATSQTLVQWRTTGLLRRLRLSPAPISSVFGARVAVSLLLALIQMAVFLLVAQLPVFGLKLAHYWWMAIPMLVCGVLAFLSIGMVIGAWAKTQESAQAMTQIVVLPMAFLGGSFFPLSAAPGWYQALSYAMPLRYLNTGMTNVIARGEGPGSALPYMLVLLGIAAVFSVVGLRLFKWDDA